MLPARVGSTIRDIDTKHITSQISLFRPRILPSAHHQAPIYGPPMHRATVKNAFKNQHFFNISAFEPHQTPTYSHPTCHLRSSGSIFTFWQLCLWFFWKCAPCQCRKHNSRYRHKAFYIKNLTFPTTSRRAVRSLRILFASLTLQKMLQKPTLFQHFRFLAPPNPHIYPSHLPCTVFRLLFSLSDTFFSYLFWKCAHTILNVDPKAVLIKNLSFSTSSRPW